VSNASPDEDAKVDPDDAGTSSFASPACYADEADQAYFSAPVPIAPEELIAQLNSLLEAERAGAKTLAYYLKTSEPGALRDALDVVGRDEARYAALLTRVIREHGGDASAATGDFFAKAKALDDPRERLVFLNRGQGWVVRKLAELLPRLADAGTRDPLAEMHHTHVENIRMCEKFL
jgi:nitronate monooxygenase